MATIWTDKKRSLFFGLPLSFTKYICTDEKFIVEAGMLSTREDEIRLYRILDLTIKCDTMDKSMPKLEIKNIKKSRDVKEIISEAVEKERVKKRVSSRENMMSYGMDCDCDCDSDCDHEEDMDQ